MLHCSPSSAGWHVAGSAALLDFGTLIWRHDRDFDEKWVKPLGRKKGRACWAVTTSRRWRTSRMAFEHVDRMQLIPFDKKALVVWLLAALIPMIPLVGTTIP